MDIDFHGASLPDLSPRREVMDIAPMAPQEATYEPPSPIIPDTTHCQPYPKSAGAIFGHASTHFDILSHERGVDWLSVYHPFANSAEWELAETLMTSGMSLGTIDKLLKLSIVCFFVVCCLMSVC